MKALQGPKVLAKIGGSLALDESALASFAGAVAGLANRGFRIAVVHGGGKDINANIALLDEEPRFIDGLRVTTDKGMNMVEMTLSGGVNKRLVRMVAMSGGQAVGISGSDGGLLRARPTAKVELGRVGEVHGVNTAVVELLWQGGFVPIISPVALGDDGLAFNVNADTAAAEVATALQADKFILISDVAGVLDADKKVFPELNAHKVEELIAQSVISGGMIPKVRASLDSIARGLGSIHIVGWKDASHFMDQITGAHNYGTILK